MSTIQEVAKEAGVSVATVSRVLNNSIKVVPKTRKAVMEAIEKLNYKPNLLGRNLRRMETKMILVLLPNISNPFYSLVVKGIEDIGHTNGYNIMLCNTDSQSDRERVYIELLRNRLADGVIFMAPELSCKELSEIGKKYPVVQCCEYVEGASVSHISVDNKAAARKAMNHLLSLGHRRIGLISSKNNFLSSRLREEAYRGALEEAGIQYDPRLVIYGDYGFKSGLRAGKQFLSLSERPTAVFAISDQMALGTIKAAIEDGLRVPEDLAVVGFDNINLASMYIPSLTTITQPKYDLGCFAMEMLLRQIKDKNVGPEYMVLEHELTIRESTMK